jgi:hypothetical protein
MVAMYVIFIRKNASKDELARIEPTRYAKAGEIVTCLNGHEICTVAKDIFVFDLISVSQFKNWRHQPQPVPHDTIKSCTTCGAPYVSSEMPYGGTRLHIDGEWRTTRS